MIDKLIFLLEATGEQIKKYYVKVPENIYNQILLSDPTAIIKNNEVKKVGKYSKTVLDIWLKTKFDINLAKPALESWHTNAKNIKTQLSKAKTIDDIMQWSQNASLQVTAEKESKIVLKSSNIILRQILSKAAAIFYGNFAGMNKKPTKFQSSWCTSYPSGSYYDRSYNKQKGDLYILAKTNGELIAQLFFGKNEMEIHDNYNSSEIEASSFDAKIVRYFMKKYDKDITKNKSTDNEFEFNFQGHTIEANDPMEENEISFDEIVIDHCNLADFTILPWDNIDGPKWFTTRLNATHCNLKSLKNNGCLSISLLDVSDNDITSLIGMPKDITDFYIDDNKLTNFKGLELSQSNGCTSFSGNKITSFENFPKINSNTFGINDLGINVRNNKLITLKGIPQDLFDSSLNISKNPTLKNLDYLPKNISQLYIDKKWKNEIEKIKITNNIKEIFYK